MISLNKNYRKRYEYCFLLKHDHPWGSTFVDYKVTTDIRTDISHAKIFSLYPLCILAKPFLILFKQTLGQSTKYWPKTNYKSIQQHFKIFTEQKSDTYQIKWGVCLIYPSLYTFDTIREPTQADMLTFNSCSIFSHPPRVSSIHSFGGVVEEEQCLYAGLRLIYQSVVWG